MSALETYKTRKWNCVYLNIFYDSVQYGNWKTTSNTVLPYELPNLVYVFGLFVFVFVWWVIESLIGAWYSLSRTGWLTGKAQTCSCLHLPRTRIKSTLCPIQVISGSWVLGITLRTEESTFLTEPPIFLALLLTLLNHIGKTNKYVKCK